MQTRRKALLAVAVMLAGLLAGPLLGARTAAAQPAGRSGQTDLLSRVQLKGVPRAEEVRS